MLMKIAFAMALAVVVAVTGDILMSQGMKSLGHLKVNSLASLWQAFLAALREWRIPVAVLFMCLFFVLWLSVLSESDLSLALPITALTYVLNALLAKPILGEHVSFWRWIGTLVIFVGVVVVVIGDAQTDPAVMKESAWLLLPGSF